MSKRWITVGIVAAVIALIAAVVLIDPFSATGGNDDDAGPNTTEPTDASTTAPPADPVTGDELSVTPLSNFPTSLNGALPTEPGPVAPPTEIWTNDDVGCGERTCDIAADADHVFVLINLPDFEGYVAAYDGATGEEAWKVDYPHTVIRIRAVPGGLLVEHDDGISLLDPETGDERWTREVTLWGMVGPNRDLALVTSFDGPAGKTEVLGPDGEAVWSNDAMIATSDGACPEVVFTTDLSGEHVLDAETGAEIDGTEGQQTIVCDDRIIAITDGSGEASFQDWRTRNEIARVEVGESFQLVDGWAVRSDGTDVSAIRLTDPSTTWEATRPDGQYYDAYRVEGGLVQVDTVEGHVVGFDVTDGTVIGPVEISDGARTTPTTRLLMVSSPEGIEAFAVDTLEPLWSVDLDVGELGEVVAGGDRAYVLTDDALVALGAE